MAAASVVYPRGNSIYSGLSDAVFDSHPLVMPVNRRARMERAMAESPRARSIRSYRRRSAERAHDYKHGVVIFFSKMTPSDRPQTPIYQGVSSTKGTSCPQQRELSGLVYRVRVLGCYGIFRFGFGPVRLGFFRDFFL